ncbi:unnamed protein product [Angiostrongylus costaricensis]|uniref:DNA replication complex GINS protein PSF1 n=1 Tax=Angiostrongylus costaricensis TaxID=334426 RepID=A0A158PLZ0_ANGCS|nr:unnamed protein product [Angiostrongylus costaricensis]
MTSSDWLRREDASYSTPPMIVEKSCSLEHASVEESAESAFSPSNTSLASSIGSFEQLIIRIGRLLLKRMRVENDNLEGVADQALSLLTEMKRNPDVMPPYNEAVMRACIAKMNELYSQNNECVTRLRSEGERASRELEALMICRNEALQHIRNNLCEAEIEFFNEYCSCLAEFQAGIGENGVNLLLSTHPPKALYVQVG